MSDKRTGLLNPLHLLNTMRQHKTKTKLRGFSPRANHTDRAAAAGRQSECQLFADRGVSRG